MPTPSTGIPKKRIRFATRDEYIDRYSDSETEISPINNPKSLGISYSSSSQSDSTSTASDGSSILATPPASEDLQYSPEEGNDSTLPHSFISPAVNFVWDMAQHPDTLDILSVHGDAPAVVWKADQAPLSTFSISVDGIYKWNIVLNARGRSYPTLHDTLMAIWENTSKIVSKVDAEELPPYIRGQVFKAREMRCREFVLPAEKEPLRRIDFMLESRQFVGISSESGTRNLTLHIGIISSRE
ncbi:hypothetical protein HYPSUDRAFT_45223 [Hypholoma sublateritium FD-334 SS-4]|uniref:DUF6699 domain-containing protein n=1 Tax=Hypholoma sublateritium (strain FD-334 SS-4) TaxID=945553 RepID=A0A0D2NHT7_HYPSF|nr:hypothetical protein HYPSUDRAFT_45223 [Hypholoma sublateritium FD-334 SS-4]